MDIARVEDHDVLRQMRVERIGEAVGRYGGVGAEVCDVDPRMDARVGSSAAGHMHLMPDYHGGGFLERLRHGSGIFLHLPAVVGGAVVF